MENGSKGEKHIALQVPFNSATEYFNYKHSFSIVLFAVVHANYNNFTYANVDCQGRLWYLVKRNSKIV